MDGRCVVGDGAGAARVQLAFDALYGVPQAASDRCAEGGCHGTDDCEVLSLDDFLLRARVLVIRVLLNACVDVFGVGVDAGYLVLLIKWRILCVWMMWGRCNNCFVFDKQSDQMPSEMAQKVARPKRLLRDSLKRKLASKKEKKESHLKTRRFRPGTVALREVRKFQSTVGELVPKAPFKRLIRESLASSGMKIASTAVDAIQEAAESYLVALFGEAQLLVNHCHRTTVRPKDLMLALRLRGQRV